MSLPNRCVGAVAALLFCSGAALAQQTMYAMSGNISPVLHRLDPITGGALESLPVSGHEALFGGLANTGGSLYSIDGFNDSNPDRTFRIDPSTGVGVVVGPTGFNWNFRTVHAHPGTGVLYGARDNQLFTIDTSTGQATPVAAMTGPGLGQITAMAINSAGQAYITNISGVDLFTLDLATGATSLVGTIGGTTNWFDDLAFDENDVLYGARTQGGVYTIDTSTAVETFVFSGSYTGLTFVVEGGPKVCYANCDESTVEPVLNVADFTCFLQRFAAGESYANCDESTVEPVLNVADFTCFLQEFAAGCS